MKRTICKLVTIIAEDELEKRLLEELKSLGAGGYTLVRAKGQGLHHLRASEWEGENTMIQLIVSEEIADRIFDHLADRYFGRFSVTAYAVAAEVLRGGKFA
jgi:nitrogen regulatory protein P-II 2